MVVAIKNVSTVRVLTNVLVMVASNWMAHSNTAWKLNLILKSLMKL